LREPIGVTVALVTGGARGIGLAIAQRLAEAGHVVAIADRAGAEEAAAAIPGGEPHPVDLADGVAIERLAGELLDRHGRVDVLVNNAAHLGRHGLADLEPDLLRRFLAVNVEAPLALARALVPAMAAAGRGRIINIVSNTVWSPPGPGMVAYVTSKGGLLGLTRSLAVEVGPSGITVNAVAPGLTPTPGSAEGMTADAFAGVLDRQAVKRTLEARDIAAAVAFLASDEAGAISGQALRVDGGLVTL
jgi:NAD(P)-dependent dehydrogenase (short-subunit alcohol dehydrogenase family)